MLGVALSAYEHWLADESLSLHDALAASFRRRRIRTRRPPLQHHLIPGELGVPRLQGRVSSRRHAVIRVLLCTFDAGRAATDWSYPQPASALKARTPPAGPRSPAWTNRLNRLLVTQDGVATTGQLFTCMSNRELVFKLKTGQLQRIWYGVYGRPDPDLATRLRALDVWTGSQVAVCFGTAAAMHGFDTEDARHVHILNPPGHQVRSARGLVVHHREDIPLSMVQGAGRPPPRGRPSTSREP